MTSQCKSTRNFKKASSKTSLEPPLHVEGNRWNYQKYPNTHPASINSMVLEWGCGRHTGRGCGTLHQGLDPPSRKKTVAIGVCRAMPSITSVGAERWLMVLRIIQTIPYNCKGLRRRESHFNVLVAQTRHFFGAGMRKRIFFRFGPKNRYFRFWAIKKKEFKEIDLFRFWAKKIDFFDSGSKK